MNNNKLEVHDLINVGIFTAIYFCIYFATIMLGYIPIFVVLLGLIAPIMCGIPFMLYVTKVKKFGMISLTGVILGIIFLLMGSGVIVFLFCAVCGIVGDFIMKLGRYESWNLTVWGYSIFSLLSLGFYGRIYFMRNEFFKTVVEGYGQEYADVLSSLTPVWAFPVFGVSCIIGGVLGAYLGKKILNKHFKRAGIL